jgi:hypothetical protein
MAPVLSDYFDPEKVYARKFSGNDKKESSRLYVTKSAAHRICPQAFGSDSNKSHHEVSFLDAGLNRFPMIFHRRPDNKCYLTGGWRDFVKKKKLSRGDIITIHEYTGKSGTGERFFMIGSKLIFGRLMG